MTRNVGITLTDLAYQVWVGIPHGLRSKLISEFLTKNAEALTNLESPYDKYLRLKKPKIEESITKLFTVPEEPESLLKKLLTIEPSQEQSETREDSSGHTKA
jgi:hypothetical protein